MPSYADRRPDLMLRTPRYVARYKLNSLEITRMLEGKEEREECQKHSEGGKLETIVSAHQKTLCNFRRGSRCLGGGTFSLTGSTL